MLMKLTIGIVEIEAKCLRFENDFEVLNRFQGSADVVTLQGFTLCPHSLQKPRVNSAKLYSSSLYCFVVVKLDCL